MNPNAAFSASLVTSLILWYPSMQACLRGDLDLTPAALRYLAALAVSRLAINFLARLLNAYRAQQQRDPTAAGTTPAGSPAPSQAPTGPEATPEQAAPHRRRSDISADDDGEQAPLAA